MNNSHYLSYLATLSVVLGLSSFQSTKSYAQVSSTQSAQEAETLPPIIREVAPNQPVAVNSAQAIANPTITTRNSLPTPISTSNSTARFAGSTRLSRQDSESSNQDPAPTTDKDMESLPTPEVRTPNQAVFQGQDDQIQSQIDDEDKEQRELLLNAARNAVGLMDLKLAAQRYEELLAAFPKDDEARFEYAGILNQIQRYSESVTNIELVLTRYPNQTKLLDLLISNYMQMREFGSAARFLERRYDSDRFDINVALRYIQALLLDGQRQKAVQVFAMLERSKIKDLNDVELTAQILFDLNNPQEAMNLLAPNLQDGNLSSKSLGRLIRSAARVDQVELVRQAANQYLVLNPDGMPELIEIGTQLLDEGSGVASVAVFEILFERSSGKITDGSVIIGLANALTRQFRFEESSRLIETYRETLNPLAGDLIIAKGYREMGHPFEAIALTDNILVQTPNDVGAAIVKARSLLDIGQYDVAESILTKITSQYSKDIDSRFALAELYTRLAKHELASEIYRELHIKFPGLVFPFDELIKSLIRQKDFKGARMAIDGLRTRQGFEAVLTNSANLGMARLFSAQGQLVEAIEIAKKEALVATDRRAEALLIIYTAAYKLGDEATMEAAKMDLINEVSKSVPVGIRIADEAMLACFHDLAQCLYNELKSTTGGQIAIVNRLGESYLRGNAVNASTAIAEFKSVLAFAPGNSRAKLGLANAYQQVRDFKSAEAELVSVTELMPNHVNAKRQLARLASNRVGRKAGNHYYEELEAELPTNTYAQTPEPVHGHVYSVGKTIHGSSDLQTAIGLEKQAKYLKDWRPTQAIDNYESLVMTEPGNLDAYFDLGQQYALKNRTLEAMDVYDRMLCVDPCNCDAITAKLGLGRSVQPNAEFNFIYFDQEGRVGLAEIKRLSFDWSYTIQTGNEDEFYKFHYSHLILDPDDDATLLGNVFGASIRNRIWNSNAYYYGDLDVEIYDNGRLSNRPVFDVGFGYELPFDINLEIGGFLENVKENGETLRQDIYYGGGKMRAFWRPLPRWFIDGQWRFSEYSDGNVRNDLKFENVVNLLAAPHELNLHFDYEFLSYAQQTVFSPGPGTRGTRFPYFAPNSFSILGIGFEYKHWLSQNYYKGANHSWLAFEYTPQWDSLNEFYNIARFGIHHQHGNNLTFGAEFKFTRSSVYDNNIATSYLQWFF